MKRILTYWLLFSWVGLSAQSVDTTQINRWNSEARSLLDKNEFENAIATINKAEKAAHESDWDQGLLKILATKSSIQNIYNRHFEALSTGLKGLELAKSQKNKYYEVLFYRSLANNYDMLDNYDKAVPFYEKCISESDGFSEAERIRGHCFVELGDAYRLHFKKPAEAKSLIEKGIEIYKKTDSSALGYAYDYLGEALSDLGMFQDAERVFAKAKIEMEKYGDEYLMPELLFHTANMYLSQKQHDKAISIAKEGLSLSREMQTIYGESEANRSLYQAYKAKGNTDLALAYYEKYIVLRDSLTKANIDSRFEQIQNEVELQKKEKELSELRQKTNQRNFSYFLAGLISLLLISIFFIRYFRKQSALLQAKNKRISEALFVGQAAGKQQLYMQVRDSLGSSISAINWTLDTLLLNMKSADQQQMVESLRNQLKQSYEKVNLLSKNILPEDIENQGLKSSIGSLLQSTNRTNGTKYQAKFPEDFRGTEPKIEFAIYNIVQELILLDQKYGDSHETIFEIDVNQQKVALSVEGLQMNHEMGQDILIQHIELRVEGLNGKIDVNKKENQVFFEFPLVI